MLIPPQLLLINLLKPKVIRNSFNPDPNIKDFPSLITILLIKAHLPLHTKPLFDALKNYFRFLSAELVLSKRKELISIHLSCSSFFLPFTYIFVFPISKSNPSLLKYFAIKFHSVGLLPATLKLILTLLVFLGVGHSIFLPWSNFYIELVA